MIKFVVIMQFNFRSMCVVFILFFVFSGKGDLFGADIDFDEPISVCNFDVRSLTYSELQCINIKGLTDVLALYPDFAEKFAKDIKNDITYNLRRSLEDSDEVSPRGKEFPTYINCTSSYPFQGLLVGIRASSRKNLSSGFPSERVSKRSPQLQRLSRKLKLYL